MSNRELCKCKKCNSLHEGNGDLCGICQDEIIEKLEEEIAAAMDKYEGEVIVNTRLRDSIRWKNIIINRLNQRPSGMVGQG